MNRDLKTIIYVIILTAIQILMDNYLDLGVYVYLFIIPYFILLLPYKYKTISTMLIAFLLGLFVDFLSNGVLGLNAAALTAMALTRQSFLKLVVNEQSMGKYDTPAIKDIGFIGYAIFITLSYLVFFIFYVLFDSLGSGHILLSLLKILISTIANTVLIIILSYIIQQRR